MPDGDITATPLTRGPASFRRASGADRRACPLTPCARPTMSETGLYPSCLPGSGATHRIYPNTASQSLTIVDRTSCRSSKVAFQLSKQPGDTATYTPMGNPLHPPTKSWVYASGRLFGCKEMVTCTMTRCQREGAQASSTITVTDTYHEEVPSSFSVPTPTTRRRDGDR